MNLLDELSDYCKKNLTIYGFADVTGYTDRIVSDELKEYTHAVSIGINIPDVIVDNLGTTEGLSEYKKAYTKINLLLDESVSDIVKIIKKHGYKAQGVYASRILDNGNLEGDISHKLVAYLSGQGWIGKSTLLINPHYGPRIRWATILTDCILPSNNRIVESRCANCNLCVVNCPVNAFKNVEFNENESRDARYDAFKCKDYFGKLETDGKAGLCGLCVKVCPWGVVNKNSRIKDDLTKL